MFASRCFANVTQIDSPKPGQYEGLACEKPTAVDTHKSDKRPDNRPGLEPWWHRHKSSCPAVNSKVRRGEAYDLLLDPDDEDPVLDFQASSASSCQLSDLIEPVEGPIPV